MKPVQDRLKVTTFPGVEEPPTMISEQTQSCSKSPPCTSGIVVAAKEKSKVCKKNEQHGGSSRPSPSNDNKQMFIVLNGITSKLDLLDRKVTDLAKTVGEIKVLLPMMQGGINRSGGFMRTRSDRPSLDMFDTPR